MFLAFNEKKAVAFTTAFPVSWIKQMGAYASFLISKPVS
jgi:hypothetical protein